MAALLFRARGTFALDTALAHWLGLLLPVPLVLWLWARDRQRQITYAGITAVGFVGLILTFTRGAWMAFFLTTALLCVLLWRQMGFSREYWLVLGQVAVVFGLILLVLSTPIRARLFSKKAIGRSVRVRDKLSDVAAEMTYSNLLWGVGLGSFAERAEEFGARTGFQAAHPDRMPHNVYLAVTSETGLVGLGLFLVFLTAAGFLLFQTLSAPWALAANVGRALLAGFCSLMVYNFVSWGLLSYQVFPLFWALLGLASSLRQLSLRTSELG
jgi:O-antigen ligase